jgi:uncharacterized protein (DUF2249 family)/quercetin dioxygenase-like cupin family protein
MSTVELDVRRVPKPQRHPLIFDRFADLAAGETFVLINSHDPQHLRQEFERDHPGQFAWDYVESGPQTWRVRIGKRSSTDVPRVLCNTYTLARSESELDVAGAVWKLDPSDRQLDANLIRLRPEGRIEAHRGPDLDVLLFIVAGTGELITTFETVPLQPGHLVWLPRRSERSLVAGPDGLSYVTVHPRRPALGISPIATD